jgi:hypothetical protein
VQADQKQLTLLKGGHLDGSSVPQGYGPHAPLQQ